MEESMPPPVVDESDMFYDAKEKKILLLGQYLISVKYAF